MKHRDAQTQSNWRHALRAHRSKVIIGACALFVALAVYFSMRPDPKLLPTQALTPARIASATQVSVSLGGSVSNASGVQLKDAQVCAHFVDNNNPSDDLCATSTQGRYALALIPGRYRVTASAVGHASQSKQVELTQARTLDFTLATAKANLAGLVRSGSGRPLADVRIASLVDGQVMANVTTNEQGEFSAAVPAGPVVITAAASGYAAKVVRTFAPSSDISIVMYAAGKIVGAVRYQSTNEPLANVRVQASRQPFIANVASEQSTRTNAEGRFELSTLGAGTWFLSVREQRLVSSNPIQVMVDPSLATQDVILLVHDGAQLSGQLLLDEQPCSRGRVQLLSEAKSNVVATPNARPDKGATLETIAIATANSEGRVVFAAVAAGHYMVLAECDESALLDGPSTLSIFNADVEGAVWHFAKQASLEVNVTDMADRPIVEAMLALVPLGQVGESDTPVFARRAAADKQGMHRFGGLTPGQYELRARPGGINGIKETSQVVQIGGSGAENRAHVVLPGVGDIQIELRNSRGDPSSKLLFFAQSDDQDRYEAFYVGEGRYRIFPLPRGRYRVWAYDNKNAKQSISPDDSQFVVIDDAKTVVLRHTYKERGGIIKGRLVDSSGKGLANVSVSAVSTSLSSDDEYFSVVQRVTQGEQHVASDRDGYFQIADLDEGGMFRVLAQTGLAPAMRDNVRPGDQVELRVQR